MKRQPASELTSILSFLILAVAIAQRAACCQGRSQVSRVNGLDTFIFEESEGCSTNRALGYAIGRQYKDKIAARIKSLGPQLEKAIAFTSTEEGDSAYNSLVNVSALRYPQYWEEIKGIIEGSEIPAKLIILLNFRQELSILAEAGGKKSGVDDCSDVMVKEGDPSLAFLGHNEDNTHDTVNTSYFVQATINGRSWTAFTYAGELSTAAWGFNDAGVSFTLNAVYANEVNTHGVGRTFVSRSILDAPNLQAAVERVQEPNQATGHNINLIGLDEKAIVTIETAPGNLSDVKIISNESYFHANAYLRLNVPQSPGNSSQHRQDRAKELKAPRTREDILRILGDTKDPEFPIWRSGSDNVYTLCTAFFDLQAETVEVIFDNPKKGLSSSPLYTTLPLRRTSVVVSH